MKGFQNLFNLITQWRNIISKFINFHHLIERLDFFFLKKKKILAIPFSYVEIQVFFFLKFYLFIYLFMRRKTKSIIVKTQPYWLKLH